MPVQADPVEKVQICDQENEVPLMKKAKLSPPETVQIPGRNFATSP